MCGISGIVSPEGYSSEHLTSLARAMRDALAHRGPDDSGLWTSPKSGIALGHRRLAILDLSPLGGQPMTSQCGRYVLCHNGEVYNHPLLRKELEATGHSFSGTSDTETMLAAFVEWGLLRAIHKFIGMFAFALWDNREKRLHLVRDRLGIKPLYYGRAGKDFIFGSELKALRTHPNFDNSINRSSLALYFRHNYVPAPHCIYKDVYKLEPGTLLTLKDAATAPVLEKYWSAQDTWVAGASAPFTGDESEAVQELERILTESVSMRMLSDVPLGVFLSGGIDSSLVAALAQKASPSPVRTFSIGFEDDAYNEAPYAKQVADHLGTKHTEMYVTPQALQETIPLIPRHWDEPFADSSQIPAYCLSRMTRDHVAVALSGDGGDELFSGYERYTVIDRAWHQIRHIPLPLRRLIATGGRAIPASLWKLVGSMGPKIHWRLGAMKSRTFNELYRYILSHTQTPEEFSGANSELVTPFTHPDMLSARIPLDNYQSMSLIDLQTYLPDDILTKVDRATMAVALEARVPLLDHRVVEFAAKVPTHWKISNGEGKHILKRVLYNHIPPNLVDRPKKGFTVPIDQWMRKELREWCETLLDENRLRAQGYIDAGHVRYIWREYLSGQRNWFSNIWDILMFQTWLEETR